MATPEEKLAALHQMATVPEYATIVPLFAAIFDYVRNNGQTGIGVDTAPDRGARTAAGFPLLLPADIRVDREVLTRFLLGLVAVLREHGNAGDDALARCAQKLSSGAFDPGPLIPALLERRRAPLDEAATGLAMPPPLLEYLMEIPLKTALEQYSAEIPPEGFPEWQESLCPVCGSPPGMAELAAEEGRRLLSCSTCFFKWPFKRLKCPFCGCEDTEKLSYFTVDDGPTRVDSCGACSRYLKTRDSRRGNAAVPLEVEDLLTIHLDLMAAREGLERGR